MPQTMMGGTDPIGESPISTTAGDVVVQLLPDVLAAVLLRRIGFGLLQRGESIAHNGCLAPIPDAIPSEVNSTTNTPASYPRRCRVGKRNRYFFYASCFEELKRVAVL